MATRTIADGGGIWTDNATWVEGTAPTNADDVVATATSGNVTISSNAVCRSADFTGYLGTLTHNNGISLTIGDGSGGALNLVAGMTYTLVTFPVLKFASTSNNGTAGWNITTAGKTMPGTTFDGVGGKWVFQDAYAVKSGDDITLTNGTLDTNGVAVSCRIFASNNTNTRSLTLGASTVTVSNAGTCWNVNGTNLTLSAASSTITCSGAGANFLASGTAKTYGNVTFTGTGTCRLSTTTAGVFATITRSNAAACGLRLDNSATTVCTGLSIDGSAGAPVTLDSLSAGSAATLSIASGTKRVNHCAIKDITATGGATFEAYDSVNTSNNLGWTFKQGSVF